MSVSLTSRAGSQVTFYVNACSGECIYAYQRDELLGHVRREVCQGISRAKGNSNDDTFSVLVPLPVNCWARRKGRWVFIGEPTQGGVSELKQLLS